PGWLSGSEMFERIFTGVVLTSAADPIEAWMLFYGNSLRRYDEAGAGDALADFASIHRHADALVPADASVLEIGCCFGFLSLRLARAAGRSVIASDLSAGTVGLLRVVADRLGVPLGTLVADAARVPRPDRSVDVVLMVHLLEHLDPDHCRRAIDEALRVADRRVVIAVPYEDEPTPAFGHLRTLDESDLRAWGSACPGWTWSVHEHLGGWLILDRG
ncbi:MAG TPA: mycofactocin oligosaccharide methyltransferase MftM, partial [Nakamurella multipartita]|nr:mycofactocin oligosaccharide methyltransferase MftM [Nakamurella multipartita]